MLAQLLAKCIQLIGITQGIQDVLNKLLGKVATAAVELTPLFIQNTVIAIDQAVNIGPQSLANIQAQLATFQATTALDVTAILTAIGNPQQSGVAVTLPDPAPAGYGGSSSGDNASAVWNYVTGFPSGSALAALAEIRYTAVGLGEADASFPTAQAQGWFVSGPWFDPRFTPDPRGSTFALDFSTILATDANANDWCRRVYPDASWEVPVRGTCVLFGDDDFAYSLPWLTQPIFDALKAAAAPSSLLLPPVWPGLANVTLGTAVPLAVGVTISEPMDGVLISITSAPTKQGYFTFDDTRSYRNIGALAFVTDDGELEYPQTLGFTSAIYCPKTQVRAAGVKVRALVDVLGTITPWLAT